MDKQKNIEEMARDICNMCRDMYGACDNKEEPCPAIKAEMEYLYNAGYRKIPENAVVLTKEEYDKLQSLKDDYVKGYEAGVDEGWDNAHKETAEKLINELLTFLGSRQMFSIIDGEHKTLIELNPLWKKVVELAKKNGVEVKD